MVTVAPGSPRRNVPEWWRMVLQRGEARARTGRTTPTEREALLGSPEHRSRSQGYDLARKIVGTVVLGTCVGVAALSSQTRGYFMRSMGYTDPRPYIIDFGDSVSPSFQAPGVRVPVPRTTTDLHTKLDGEEPPRDVRLLQPTRRSPSGEPSFEKCYTKHFSSNPLSMQCPSRCTSPRWPRTRAR